MPQRPELEERQPRLRNQYMSSTHTVAADSRKVAVMQPVKYLLFLRNTSIPGGIFDPQLVVPLTSGTPLLWRLCPVSFANEGR